MRDSPKDPPHRAVAGAAGRTYDIVPGGDGTVIVVGTESKIVRVSPPPADKEHRMTPRESEADGRIVEDDLSSTGPVGPSIPACFLLAATSRGLVVR